jgi:hypothetical protein
MKRLGDRIFFAFVCLILFSIFGFAVTNISGIIFSDTTWTLAASPYIVTGNFLVNSGITLTIEPGVIIKNKTNPDTSESASTPSFFLPEYSSCGNVTMRSFEIAYCSNGHVFLGIGAMALFMTAGSRLLIAIERMAHILLS